MDQDISPRTTYNFSVRDLSAARIPVTIITSSRIRRQRGSRDLRNHGFHSLDDLRLPSSTAPAKNSSLFRTLSLTSSAESYTTPVEECSSHDSVVEMSRLPDHESPVSFFDFDDDDDEEESDDNDFSEISEASISPFSSFCWPSDDEWPLKADKQVKQHKDSAIVIDPAAFEFLRTHQRRISSSAVTSASISPSQRSRTSVASLLGNEPAAPVHESGCICKLCRQTRHRRRKSSVGLFEKLEDCRHIMMTIRDPNDPTNLERGRAYGYWLKLARLYVKYETLLDSPIDKPSEDEQLFIEFLTTFNGLVDQVRAEAKKWPQLFADRVDTGTTVSCQSPAQIVHIRSNSGASTPAHHRARSWTLHMLDQQGPIGNYRAIGSNFF